MASRTRDAPLCPQNPLPLWDESLANYSLIHFLSGLTMPSAAHEWLPHRQAFKPQFGARAYTAELDGYLRDTELGVTRIAVEVKSHLRTIDRRAVRSQETSQLVGWIKRDAPRVGNRQHR
ncbi:hypothetical protein F5884DRAFT_750717 [Xylogone sp. PMI_703]|nr:hypothetical protein F5884DRAFT_750717 [Xylogone sp. PMI_703]